MISAIIPLADMDAANTTLANAGYGPRNFSVPVFADKPAPTYAVLHAVTDPDFFAAIKALPNVQWSEIAGTPHDRVADAAAKVSARWGQNAPELVGEVTPGLHQSDGDLWMVLQPFDRDIYALPLSMYPAMVRRARVPGEVLAWQQPIDQFDAYKLVNPFTGEPDEVEHDGKYWRVDQSDGAGNNVSEPGVSGWVEIDGPGGQPVASDPEWVQPTGAQDAYATGDRVTHNGSTWESTTDGNVWEPGVVAGVWVQV